MKNQSRAQDMKLASLSSVIVGGILLCLKFYAYHITGSQSIFSDALESIVNVIAGIITYVVILLALKPADEIHPYGHGKMESMASTFEGGAILLAGTLIVIQSIQAFFHGNKIEEIDSGIIIVVAAGLLNGLLGLFLFFRGRKLHSEALKSSGLHLITDMLTSVGLVIALILVKFTGIMWIDSVVACLFGCILATTGGKILINSGHILLDGRDTETVKLLAEIFEKCYRPGVIQIHFTRVIRSGSEHHIDCHMIVPEFWSVYEAHEFSQEFERNVMSLYPVSGELHIHHDPCRKLYCRSCELSDCPIRAEEFVRRQSLDFLEIARPMN